ncbi:polyketide synthase dehydratase domain-containing protein, partial [Candidatus Sumerlaeota bacterium]|nr:polyketide synthase dehydratase domain-containing protein [Candidatus Sumerlaeota bacterium]
GKLRVNAEARDQSKGTEYSQVEHLYREILFHGEHLRGIEEIGSLSSEGIIAHIRNAPAPAVWMEEPIRSGWLADPLVLDAAFQAMIAWTRGQFGAASLPCAIAEYRQFQRQYPA